MLNCNYQTILVLYKERYKYKLPSLIKDVNQVFLVL